MPAKDPTDSETSDPGYRSRSQSRRARRRKQQATQQQSQSSASASSQQQQPPPKQSLSALKEEDAEESQAEAEAVNTMQPFEYIGPDATSMDGPVTYARARRGEIPMRPGNPNQQLKTGPEEDKQDGGSLMDQDGLKLKLELNLDVEIELKARVRGDLTLALLA